MERADGSGAAAASIALASPPGIHNPAAAGDSRVHSIDTTGWLDAPTGFVDGIHPNDIGGHKAEARLVPLLGPLLEAK